MWGNPYSEKTHKATAAAENHKRVQRQKEERAFLQGMQKDYKLQHMAEVRKQLEQERQEKLAVAAAEVENAAQINESNESEFVDPLKCVQEFNASVRCIEIIHGGTTLWSGEEDGSIGVRNGVDGSLVYVIDKKEDGQYVDTLFFNDSLMWVGLSSGTIRVYDAQVFVLVYESQVHSKSVSSFAQTFDGKIFSASVDGTIAKWEIEGAALEVAAHLTGNTSALRCITSYGYNLFAAADDNLIHCLDTETGVTTQLFEGHEAPVTSVVVLSGLLISGSEDGTLGVWNIGTGLREQTLQHGKGVTSLMPDPVGGNVWSTDASGTIKLWSAHKGEFVEQKTVAVEPGTTILSLKGLVAIDALKVWTMGSNGECHVWHAAKNRIEDSTRSALRAMQAIIAEDEVELAKWSELIKTMEEVFLRLKDSIASNMLTGTERSTQREFYLRWKRFVLFSHLRRTKKLLADRLERNSLRLIMQRSYTSLANYLQQKKTYRAKSAVSEAMRKDQQRQLTNVFWAKLQLHYKTLRARETKMQLSSALERRTSSQLLSSCFMKLRQWVDYKNLRRKQQIVAASILLRNESTLQHQSYIKWKSLLAKRSVHREAMMLSQALYGQSNDYLMKRYMSLWMIAVKKLVARRQAAKAAAFLLNQNERGVLRSFYNKWSRFTTDSRDKKRELEYNAGEKQAADLREKLNAIEHLVRRRRLIDDVQSAINAALQERLRKQERAQQLDDEATATEQAIIVKREGAKVKREQSVAEQVADLIAELKCKLVNIHADFTVISKIVEKSKHIAAPKIFLENHQAVKRVVVELTGEAYLSADATWPLSKELVKQLKPHHVEQVLTAIKTMIVTFDIMTPQDRANLTSDKEIVINAEWIQAMADHCIKVKLKRLGKSAFRAK